MKRIIRNIARTIRRSGSTGVSDRLFLIQKIK